MRVRGAVLTLALLAAVGAGAASWPRHTGAEQAPVRGGVVNAYGGECVDSECWAPGHQAVPGSYPCDFNAGVDTCWPFTSESE